MSKLLFIFFFLFVSCIQTSGNDPIAKDEDSAITDTSQTIADSTNLIIDPDSIVAPIGTDSISSDTLINPSTIDKAYFLYIGTYTDGGSKGIYLSEFDADSGIISPPVLAASINNPSFQCITPNKKQLWSVNESWNGIGQVVGFSIDSLSGKLTKIKAYSSEGNAPCFVSYHQKTRDVLAANYNSGDVVQIPVTEKGEPNGTTHLDKHIGSGPNTSRQQTAHAHCIKIDNKEKYIYSCDLGTDKIYVYTIENNKLNLFKEIKTAAGAGPRHLDFHPENKCMAVINELNGTVVTYTPDVDGCFSIEKVSVSSVAPSFKGESKSADIHFSPNGRFLYASNRGNNSIAIFKMKEDSTPEIVDWQTQNLNVTRNFTIDASGKFLIAANQDGNNISVFSIDQETGLLTFTGTKVNISKPVCVTLLEK
jgi:6-phosphogluconolactonase